MKTFQEEKNQKRSKHFNKEKKIKRDQNISTKK